MSAAWQIYIITVLVYTGIDLMAVWALNLQFGLGGILNFAFIIFQAVGAYVAATLALGPSSAGGFQRYILGANLPWPLPVVAAGLAGGALALAVGLIAMRVRRIDYQGMVLLTVSLLVTAVVTDYPALFNGVSGVAGVPRPFQSSLGLTYLEWSWFYVGLTAAFVIGSYAAVRRLTRSPWGRQLRAIRENANAAQAVGIDVNRRRMQAFVLGGVLAGVSGGVFVEFIGAWAPASWATAETFFFFAALVIGGRGSNAGVAMGAVLVFGILLNGVQFLPIFSYTTLAEAVQLIVVGVAYIGCIWFRPQGLLPERPERFSGRSSGRKRLWLLGGRA